MFYRFALIACLTAGINLFGQKPLRHWPPDSTTEGLDLIAEATDNEDGLFQIDPLTSGTFAAPGVARISIIRLAGDGATNLEFSTKDASAVAGVHYESVSETIQFVEGQHQADVFVPVLSNRTGYFEITLTAPSPSAGVTQTLPYRHHLDAWKSASILDFVGSRRNFVDTADIDTDGDEDVFIYWGGLRWAENRLASPHGHTPWVEQEITSGQMGETAIVAADVNHDGLSDLVTLRTRYPSIVWYENLDRGASWIEHTIDPSIDEPKGLAVVDVDGDADLDVVSGSVTRSEIVWWENTDIEGTIWRKHLIATTKYSSECCSKPKSPNSNRREIDLAGARTRREIAWSKEQATN